MNREFPKLMSKALIPLKSLLLFCALLLLSPTACAKQPDKSLVGYWKLDEGQGNVAIDSSGRGNNGEVKGNATWLRDTGLDTVKGGLDLDGIDDYVDCGNDKSLDLNGKNFTLMARVYIKEHGKNVAILSKELGGQNWPEYGLSLVWNSTIEASFWNANDSAGQSRVASGTKLSANRWHHIAASYNGSVYTVYVDGVQQSRTEDLFGSPYSGTSDLFIGASASKGDVRFGGPFKGRIADVAIFTRCLSDAEVKVCSEQGIALLDPERVAAAAKGRPTEDTAARRAAVAGRAVDANLRKRLFLDDYDIEQMQGLERKLHQPVKYSGNPVIKGENRWEDAGIQSRTPPQWVPQEQVWKIWYLASETPWEGEPEASHMCYAFSRDGIKWEKPTVGIFSYHGSMENNIVANNYMLNIIYDPDAAQGWGRYKGLSGAIGRFPVVSKDGVRWRSTGAAKIDSLDESFMTYDETTGQYVATVKLGGPHGRAVALSTSRDFWNWTKPELVFYTDDRDQELGRQRIEAALANPDMLVPPPEYIVPEKFETDIYNMAVFPYEGLYVGLPCVFDQTGPLPSGNQHGFMYVELTSSRDLKTWNRVGNRAVFIPQGTMNSYDRGMILSAGRPIIRDNELWFYYNGLGQLHGPPTPTEKFDHGICLAKLRLDGFVSLDAGECEGALLTKPIQVKGTHLFVNAQASEGMIRAEIMDEKGEVVPGFSAEDCNPFEGDDIKGKIKWQRKSDLSDLSGKTIKIRFLLQKASFYAFWIGE